MNIPRLPQIFCAAAAILGGLFAATPLAAQQAKLWRHAIVEAKSDSGILFMVDKGGFAAKQGLKLEMVQIKADVTGLQGLLAGELDSYEGGAQGPIVAAARGADVKIVGCNWLVIPHGIFVRDTITSLQELKGKSIAVSAPGTFPDVLARAALQKYGVSTDGIQFASVGSDLDRYKALVGGVVAAAVVSGEYEPIAAKAGIKLLVPGREALPDFIRSCIYMTGKTLNGRGDDAAHFLAAEMQALRHALSHRDETLRLTQSIIGAKPDDPRPAYIYDFAIRTSAVAPDLPLPMDKLDWLQNLLVSSGNLNKPGDLTKTVDASARAKALELAGK